MTLSFVRGRVHSRTCEVNIRLTAKRTPLEPEYSLVGAFDLFDVTILISSRHISTAGTAAESLAADAALLPYTPRPRG